MKLKGKVIVVVGAMGLLGREICKALSKEGASLVVADMAFAELEGFANSLSEALAVEMDINNKDDVLQMIGKAVRKYGRIDGLVNSAYPRNKNYGKSFYEVEYSDFCENVNLHLGGYFLVSQCILKKFEEQGHGNLVNISSIYGVAAPRFEIYEGTSMTMPVEYAAIKSALIHLTKYMAKYVSDKNIRVNCLSPGGIFADQPEKFIGAYKSQCLNKGLLEPKDLVGTLIFMLSEDSQFMNGQNLVVDDGFTL